VSREESSLSQLARLRLDSEVCLVMRLEPENHELCIVVMRSLPVSRLPSITHCAQLMIFRL